MTVSNSTPLIALAQIGLFDVLRDLFGRIRIAKAVYDETVTTGREKGGARREVSAAEWVEAVEVQDRLAVEVLLDELDRGEAETIVLARQLNAQMVLMDEKKGRRKLQVLGMPMMGTLGILLAAKEAGLIPAIRPALEALQQSRFSLNRRLVEQVLARAEE